ncbi:MAG: hypothetical protein L0229_27685 [Blastocatellia bacterium]|nr:hypothetical protein [Blastocatellia bacterium]
MTLNVGRHIWVPCEVKPGPFPDERMVRVQSKLGDWVGFVPATSLKEPVLTGETLISALIIDVRDGRFSARIPGESVTKTLYEGVVD